MKKKQIYAISIDALKFQCVGGLKPVDDLLSKGRKLTLRRKFTINEKINIIRKLNREDFGFEHSFKVFLDGLVCGTLSYINTGELKYKVKNGLSLFTCTNEFLYGVNFNANLNFVLKSLGLSVRKIDHLEVACDGHGILKTANELLNNDNKGEWHFVKKRKSRPSVTPMDILNGFSKNIKYGKDSSKKYVVFYPKSEKLDREKNKLHIKEFWSAAGLDPNLPIDRCELTIKSSRHLSGFSLNPEHWSRSYVAAFFRDQNEDIFLYQNKNGKKQSIIDFSAIEHKTEYFSKRIYNSPNTLYGIKTAIKVLYNEIGCYPCGAVVDELIKKYKLKTWFDKSRKRW